MLEKHKQFFSLARRRNFIHARDNTAIFAPIHFHCRLWQNALLQSLENWWQRRQAMMHGVFQMLVYVHFQKNFLMKNRSPRNHYTILLAHNSNHKTLDGSGQILGSTVWNAFL